LKLLCSGFGASVSFLWSFCVFALECVCAHLGRSSLAFKESKDFADRGMLQIYGRSSLANLRMCGGVKCSI